jgi:NADH:ubiquinone oxidoreductase subunit 3 (subunit A)
LSWNWNPQTWKTSTKLLLGFVTVWPVIYIVLFIVLIFSGVVLASIFGEREQANGTDLDLIQLERKIQEGQISVLRISSREIEAIDRDGRHFKTYVSNESTREEIIRQARTTDPNGNPRVAKVEENSGEPPAERLLPFGFGLFFLVHMLTILLTFALMPLYIVLAVKSPEHDQTMRIVWAVLVATMGMLVMPVYWYLYVWRKPKTTPPAGPTSA